MKSFLKKLPIWQLLILVFILLLLVNYLEFFLFGIEKNTLEVEEVIQEYLEKGLITEEEAYDFRKNIEKGELNSNFRYLIMFLLILIITIINLGKILIDSLLLFFSNKVFKLELNFSTIFKIILTSFIPIILINLADFILIIKFNIIFISLIKLLLIFLLVKMYSFKNYYIVPAILSYAFIHFLIYNITNLSFFKNDRIVYKNLIVL